MCKSIYWPHKINFYFYICPSKPYMKGLKKKAVLLYCVLEFWGRKKESKRFIKQNWTPISLGSTRRGQAACMTEHQRVRRGIRPPESIWNSPGTGKQQLLMIAARATFSPRVHERTVPGRGHDLEVSLCGFTALRCCFLRYCIPAKPLILGFYKVSAWAQRPSACPPSLIGHLQAVNSQYTPVMKGMLKEPWGWL